MFSDNGFPKAQRTKTNPVHSKDINGFVMMTLRNSPVSEKLQIRLDFTSWG